MPHPDIWYLLFEQIPPALKWVLSILTAGLYLLARYIWKRQQERLQALEGRNVATKDDIIRLEKSLANGLETVHNRLDNMVQTLFEDGYKKPNGS